MEERDMSTTAARPRRSQREHRETKSGSSTKRKRVQVNKTTTESHNIPSRRLKVQSSSTVLANQEPIDEDDICPICHQLLYAPVTTICNHSLCQECMEHWTDVTSSRMTILPITTDPLPRHSVPVLEANCPMCRKLTTASPNKLLAERLTRAYSQRYTARRKESLSISTTNIQPLDLYIGNTHNLLANIIDIGNRHEWVFFIHPSRSAIIEEIQIQLAPTFRPPLIIRQRPPYEIRRTCGGISTIHAYIILKAGYTWESDDALSSPDGVEKGMLPVEWTLDFTGADSEGRLGGSMGKTRVKVRCDAWREDEEEEELEKKELERIVKAYQRDGRWEPPDEDAE